MFKLFVFEIFFSIYQLYVKWHFDPEMIFFSGGSVGQIILSLRGVEKVLLDSKPWLNARQWYHLHWLMRLLWSWVLHPAVGCLQPFFLNTDVCVDIKRNYILFFSKGMIGCNFVSYFTA